MANEDATTSPRALARLGGVLYLIGIAVGLFCEVVVRGDLVVAGDAAATAAHLRSSEWLWRSGIAADLFNCAGTVVLAWIFYVLLQPVSRHLALLMAFLDLVAIGLEAAFNLHLLAALFPLASAAYLKAFTPEQLDALAYLSIRSHSFGFGISLLFFGCTFLVRGTLILRARFLPRTLGVLVLIAGLGYVTHGFALILTPAFAARVFPLVAAPIFIGEASLCLWLLVKGINVAAWRRMAIGGRIADPEHIQ